MKQILALLIVLLSGQTICYSQPYQSMLGDSSTSWKIVREIPDAVFTDSLYTTVDSSFGGYDYKSVYRSSYNYGFIREDTSTGKAWFYSTLDTTEYLIMDLSLSVGDSFLLNMAPWMPDSFAMVDSVYYVTGGKHIRLNYMLQVSTGQEKLTFIEGLGSNAGLLYQNEDVGGWNMVFNNYLLCAYKDGSQYYANTLFNGDCYISWVGIKEKTDNISWTLYPNPFDNYAILTFDNSKNQNFTLTLFDLQGRLVQIMENITTGQVIIERKDIPSGLFFFQLIADRQVIASGKLTIE